MRTILSLLQVLCREFIVEIDGMSVDLAFMGRLVFTAVFTDPKIAWNRGESATWFQAWKWPGNLRGTWSNECCRFLTKSKSIYKNTSRTPYKPLVEIMKIKWNKKIWCSRGVHGNQKSTHESFVSAWFSSSGTQDWTADLMIMNWFRW